MTWDVCVTIDSCEVAEYLTDTEYEQLTNILLEDVSIMLTFDYQKADPEVGIMHDTMIFTGKWGWCGLKGCPVLDRAIDKLLADIDVEDRWGELAHELYCDSLKM